MVVSVIVDRKSFSVNQSYDYNIASYLEPVIQKGMRVIVDFANKKLVGYVVDIKVDSEFSKLKTIYQVLDVKPCLTEELLSLAYKMHKYYFCLYVTALETMIPQALRGKYDTVIKALDIERLPFDLRLMFNKNNEYVLEKKNQTSLPVFFKLAAENIVTIEQRVQSAGKMKLDTYLLLGNYTKLSNLQQEIVDEFKVDNCIKKSLLVKKYSQTRIATLIKNKILLEDKVVVNRLQSRDYNDKKIVLNEEQLAVCNEIKLNEFKTYLLHGVTGSGKTEIYLEMIEKVIADGKEAIMLVPEISLTPQIIARFKGRFKDSVAVYHSGLSIGEKYDEWRKIINKEVKIVVGARSAVFAHFENLGIIIIDEEHESSYKQDNEPRYDAKIIARIRAKKHNAPVILGSATPSAISYYKALNNTYKLLTITKRANQNDLPYLHIVNMANELKSGNKNMFSRVFKDAIEETLSRDEQIIILLNRRGFSNFVMCRECGEVIKCPHCDVTMTYHKKDDSLKCHYCGHTTKNVKVCPSCKSVNIRYVGYGTQKVVETLNQLFPNESILRMDVDTTSKKGGHEQILERFKNRESRILVGTQMIAKGLDFEFVTLVGILNADISLRSTAYDAKERCYQLITQVAGRAGRHKLRGKVIVQAYDTENYAIRLAQSNSYLKFYEEEIKLRNLANNPPFTNLITILVSSNTYESSLNYAKKIKYYISSKTDVRILGPAEAEILMIKDLYRFKLTVKYSKNSELEEALEYIFLKTQEQKGISISIVRD